MSIIWLASYPKSGNTWLRAFLSNYLRDGDEPANINELEKMGIASSHSLFERYAGVESSDLTADEIDTCRPEVYRMLAAANEDVHFVKVHDAYTFLPDGRPLFPAQATQGAVYIARNPLDVAVSMRHHMNDTHIDKTIARMANPQATLAASVKCGNNQFRQKLLTWSEHVRSWLDASKPFPVHLVRYEDMQQDPRIAFAQVVAFAGLPVNDVRLAKAIRFSRFEVLQQQEAEQGFREQPGNHATFFRQGQAGGWREVLTNEQVTRIVSAHRDVMRRFGYLPEGAGDDSGMMNDE
ncbi:MAG: sulfotransferase domain-containing protein [Chloroflexi bacterium]|nr:sulfotransferase domain-containing protein [Chloroflexota bacterium]